MLRVLCAPVKYSICVSVCPTPLSPALAGDNPCCSRGGLLEAYVAEKPAKFRTYFIIWCHTCCVAWPPPPILSLLLGDHREADPPLPLLLSLLPTFFFSFFSSFFVKRVWTHQILVNMLPYARLKPRPRSHRRNWRGGEGGDKRKKSDYKIPFIEGFNFGFRCVQKGGTMSHLNIVRHIYIYHYM